MTEKEHGEGKECCKSDSECECGCSGKSCCSGKAIVALILLLVGGVLGYVLGNCHSMKHGYMMKGMMNCPMGAPMTPPAPDKK